MLFRSRKGPNKVSLVGIFQPFNDAIKLFTKNFVVPLAANSLLYYASPGLALALSLLVFISYPLQEINISRSLSFFLIYAVLRINVYPTLISGWRSNSKYASLGALRAVAQTVSYEVRLALIFIFFLIPSKTLSLAAVAAQASF